MKESKLVAEKELKYEGIKGIPASITGMGEMPDTGSWKILKPKIDSSKCIKCLLCWLHCPDTAVKRMPDDSIQFDLQICKGCGSCAEVCPVKCIEMVKAKGE